MTQNEIDHQSAEGQVPAEAQGVDQPQGSSEVKKVVPAWIISIVVHLVVLGLLSLIVYAAKEEVEEPAVKTTALPPPPKVEEPKTERTLTETEMPLDVQVEADTPSPVTNLDVPVENFSREEENDAEVPKGREEAKGDSEMGGEGGFMAIGPGGGSSGMFGSRKGGGKKRALGKFGGSKQSESAVDAALRWFKKHQSPNGQWDVDGYPVNCTENPKCEPGGHCINEGADIGHSGYAVLCFLGAGYDHHMPSKYKATVKKGIDWLVAVQKPDGMFGEQNYELGIATMALAEAYAMSNDPALKEPAQKGIDMILKHQQPDKAGGYGLGWDYGQAFGNRCDGSVSGWCVMALKSGAAAGLNIGNGMDGAKVYLERAWKAANPNFKPTDPYTDTTNFPYTFNFDPDTASIPPWPGNMYGGDLACVGALCSVFLGYKADSVLLNTMANHIMKYHFPTMSTKPTNLYYLYYDTLAIFQVGGDRWETWNKGCRDVLVNTQRKGDGCFDGSWDNPDGWNLHPIGRILSTAYCCLSLEVYYRYLPIGQVKKH